LEYNSGIIWLMRQRDVRIVKVPLSLLYCQVSFFCLCIFQGIQRTCFTFSQDGFATSDGRTKCNICAMYNFGPRTTYWNDEDLKFHCNLLIEPHPFVSYLYCIELHQLFVIFQSFFRFNEIAIWTLFWWYGPNELLWSIGFIE
jgi:hypothetical protein